MFNYAIYANIPSEITANIQETMLYLHEKYSGMYTWKTTETPHITIAYGPEISDSENEINTFDSVAIEHLLPGFLRVIDNPTVHAHGVSYFNNPNAWIIKIDFESDGLNQMLHHLRDTVPLINTRQTEFEIRDGFTYRDPRYVWAHCTLIAIKKDVDERTIIDIVADAQDHLKLRIPATFATSSISLISAKTDTPVVLC